MYAAGRFGDIAVFAVYTPSTDTWIAGQPPTHHHWFGSMVCKDNKLLLIGGQSNDVEEYDIAKKSWNTIDLKISAEMNPRHAFLLSSQQRES